MKLLLPNTKTRSFGLDKDIMAKKSLTKLSAPSEQGKIKIQVEEPNATGSPIVVSFPGGLPNSLQRASPDSSAPKFAWQKLREKSSLGRKIVGRDKHCTYSASVQGMMYDDRRTKLCIGVYDKKRGKLVLREAASRGTVYSLEQTVPSYLENNEIVKTRTAEDILNYSAAVYEDFGSSKKRKVLKSQAANQVDIDHVVGAGDGSAVLEQALKSGSMSESNRKAIEESKQGKIDRGRADQEAYEESRRKLLPAFNMDAVTPDKVYNAKEIAGEEAWSKTYNKVHACMRQSADPALELLGSQKDQDWNPCTTKLINEITPDSDKAGNRYACALLANHLMNFYLKHKKRRSIDAPTDTKVFHYGIPNEVANRFLELFATPTHSSNNQLAYAMTQHDKQKCVLHVLLLYMIAQGPKMKISNITPIADDLKYSVDDCGKLLRLAGCTITKKGSSISAALKTPLTFPPPNRGGRAR